MSAWSGHRPTHDDPPSPSTGQVAHSSRARRRFVAVLAGLTLIALIAVGISELPGSSDTGGASARLTPTRVSALLAGSPYVLAALHAQAGEILSGGTSAFYARLAKLKGYPIVINKWASWCVPCREEFGAFQRASAEYGRRVAFLGIDSGDSSRSQALAFLKSFPVSYPSYYDQNEELGEQVTDSSSTPVTVIIARDGSSSASPFIYQGQFPSVAKLEEDIQRYGLDE
jgi:thiol-disulfide isomerase/thioredoxin